MASLSVVILGCGRIAERHGIIIDKLKDKFSLLGCYDVLSDRAKDFSGRFGGIPFPTVQDAVNTKCDLVIICSPSGEHEQNLLQCIPYINNIVVEKPVGLSLQKLNVVRELAQFHSSNIFVVKQNRFNLPIVFAKTIVDEGKFGTPVMATARVRWCRTESYYRQAEWRGKWRFDGGVLTNQAIHHVDLLQYLWGPVKTVTAQSARRIADIEAEDTIVATLTFENGSVGAIEATTCLRPHNVEGSISLIGSAGYCEIGGIACNRLDRLEIEGIPSNLYDKYSENPPDVYGFGHLRYYEYVYDVIASGASSTINLDEGIKSVRIAHAIYRSIEDGQAVQVADERFSRSIERAYGYVD